MGLLEERFNLVIRGDVVLAGATWVAITDYMGERGIHKDDVDEVERVDKATINERNPTT